MTVYSSAGKRSPGHLSRQGPAVLRWCAYEAGKAHARASAPDHAYYAQVKERIDGKRAALSEARKIVRQAVHVLAELGDGALAALLTRRAPAAPSPGIRGRGAALADGEAAAGSRHLTVTSPPRLPDRTGRASKDRAAAPLAGQGHPINHHVTGHAQHAARGPR